MNDTMITVVGNVVDSPRKVRVRNGSVTNFRLASTGRRFDAATQQWVDSTTFYVDVECWNELGAHVSGSVSKGDPVVVLGAISTQEWETDGGRRSKPQVKAMAVGHNLSRGIASFTRVRSVRSLTASADEPAVDASDEEFSGAVDRLTGELLGGLPGGTSDGEPDAAPDAEERIVRGRDYVTDLGTLDRVTDGDLPVDPAHA